MAFWKSFTAHLVILSLYGCTSTARMTALDRSLVNKQITRTDSGGVIISMDGNFLLNPTAAVETFHQVAEKELGGRPYRYSYAIDKKQTNRRIQETGPKAAVTAGTAAAGNQSSYYVPIYSTHSSGGGLGGGEAAIILGSIALILLIAKLASDSRKNKTAELPPESSKPASIQPDQPTFREESVPTNILRVSGKAEPISPVTLDRSRTVEILPPDHPPVIGRLKQPVASAIGDKVREAFTDIGCPASIGSLPSQQGYRVSTTVLRAQGTAVTYSALTLEITLTDERTQKEIARWLVQAAEKPFDLKSQNERLYGPGIATGILQNPLKTQLARYFR